MIGDKFDNLKNCWNIYFDGFVVYVVGGVFDCVFEEWIEGVFYDVCFFFLYYFGFVY